MGDRVEKINALWHYNKRIAELEASAKLGAGVRALDSKSKDWSIDRCGSRFEVSACVIKDGKERLVELSADTLDEAVQKIAEAIDR